MAADELVATLSLHQSESEKLFAGAVMLDQEYARQVCGWLPANVFRDEKVRAFWDQVKGGTDASTAAMQLQAYYEFAGYMTRVTTSFDLPAFANTISTDHFLVRSAGMLSEMARAISDRDTERLRELSRRITDNSPIASGQIPNAVDVGLEFQSELDDIGMRSEMTGIPNLDTATGGLEKQTLTVIAARPSMGKSALAIQIAKWRAEYLRDRKVMLISLEMNRRSIWARMACGELCLSWRDIRSGKGTAEQLDALRDKSGDLMNRLEDRMLLDDTSRMSVDDIWRRVSSYRPKFLIVDHMGLVHSSEQNEVTALGQISWGLKMIAKQFDIPVVALYQLNRGTESRDNKRPAMSDLRGSGKIEENADNIFFLYRPDYYDDARPTQQTVSKTEILVAKFRDGVRNIGVHLQYHLDEQKFYPEAAARK